MLKKVLVMVCALSVFTMTGCIGLPYVSKEDYEAAVAERDTYVADLESVNAEIEECKETVESLSTEIETLEAEKESLEEEVESVQEAVEAAKNPLGDEVFYEITDTVAMKFNVPKGFRKLNENKYYVDNSDSSTIVLKTEQTNPYTFDFSEEDLEASILDMYEALGFKIDDFTIHTFERSTVNGYETILMDMSYTANGISIQQIEFVIQVDTTTCAMVYTTTPEFGWYEDYLKSVETIQIGVMN